MCKWRIVIVEPPAKKRKEGPVHKLIGEFLSKFSVITSTLSPHSSKVSKEQELYKAGKSPEEA